MKVEPRLCDHPFLQRESFLSVKIEIGTVDIPKHRRDRLGVKQRELAPRIIGLDCSISPSTEKVPGHLPGLPEKKKG